MPVPVEVDARCARGLDEEGAAYIAESYGDLSVMDRRPTIYRALRFKDQRGFHQCATGCCYHDNGTIVETCCFMDALLHFQLHIELSKDPFDTNGEYFFDRGEEALKKQIAKRPTILLISLIFSDTLILDVLVALSLPSRVPLPSKTKTEFYEYVFPHREMASDAVRFEGRPFCSLRLFVDLLDFMDPLKHALIVEGGAHIGDCTLIAAHKLPHARIIAFEPMRDAHELFRRSVVANRWDDRVSVVRKALSDGQYHVLVSHYPGRSAASSASPHHANYCRETEEACVLHNTSTTTLTAALHGLGMVDVMKLSLEGLEMQALRGARAFLSARRLCVLLMNGWNVWLGAPRGGNVPDELFTLLEDADMEIWLVRDRHLQQRTLSRLAAREDLQRVFESKKRIDRGVDYLVSIGRASYCNYMRGVFDSFVSQI
eukprot:GEMP01016656.1.p1 GENE.GEMP01016656.1~~GEMP01016656.1.p1  ORF type:complete len:430 (+),score=97.80 GEMP01016656.1:1072-2361(+)